MPSELTSERRRNLLTGEWVLVSPQRLQRPWQGQVERLAGDNLPAYDPGCPLCPGNVRAGGLQNPQYSGNYSFSNDYPALTTVTPGEPARKSRGSHPLFQAEAETGQCRVLCYSERHDQRLANMDVKQVADALRFLFAEFKTLDALDDVAYVQIFENRGEMMGCSMPHPHAQVWATSGIPGEPARESEQQSRYFGIHGRPMLLDYLAAEIGDGSRLVYLNDAAASMVPFWAVWPYETLIMPTRSVSCPADLSEAEVEALACALSYTLRACERLFGIALPYSMGLHPRPSDGRPHPEWQFHMHIYPPLLRSATVRKHLVGFEMLAMPQRDLTPEAAAESLRNALQEIIAP